MTQINASLLTTALQHLYDAQNLIEEALNESGDEELLNALDDIKWQLDRTCHHLDVAIDYAQEERA